MLAKGGGGFDFALGKPYFMTWGEGAAEVPWFWGVGIWDGEGIYLLFRGGCFEEFTV